MVNIRGQLGWGVPSRPSRSRPLHVLLMRARMTSLGTDSVSFVRTLEGGQYGGDKGTSRWGYVHCKGLACHPVEPKDDRVEAFEGRDGVMDDTQGGNIENS